MLFHILFQQNSYSIGDLMCGDRPGVMLDFRTELLSQSDPATSLSYTQIKRRRKHSVSFSCCLSLCAFCSVSDKHNGIHRGSEYAVHSKATMSVCVCVCV